MKKILVLSLLLCVSCTNNINNINTDFSEISSEIFIPNSIEDKAIASFKGNNIIINKYIDKNFKKEKDAIFYTLDYQKSSTIFDKKMYAIINKNGSFYPYEIKKEFFSDYLDNYSDLRNIKINNNNKITCIISKKGKIRFFDASISTFTPNIAKTPQEIIARLKEMESEFTKTKDSRGIFTATYRVISERVDKFIDKSRKEGKTREADFIEKLMLNFANKYFYAHDLYYSGNVEKTPEVWRMAFDSGRRSEVFGIEKLGNIPEVLALSMNAHIIHDLSLSLKELNFDPKDKALSDTYDNFNKILFEEKDNIVNAITKIYGKNIVSSANSFFGELGTITLHPIFNLMRNIAKNQAEFSDKDKIISRSVTYGDGIMKAVLGGNSI